MITDDLPKRALLKRENNNNMAETMQQEQQKITFPEIRDTADSYAEGAYAYAEEEPYAQEAAEAPAIDVEIEDMVWEVETEPAEDEISAEDSFSGQMHEHTSYQEEVQDTYDRRWGRTEEIPYARRINKHIFTWVFSCVCGIYGVDRFVRGQVPLGVLKLLTFGGFGFWYLADLGIAIYKSYMESGAEYQEDLHFDSAGRYV